jgi:hypothetical protein
VSEALVQPDDGDIERIARIMYSMELNEMAMPHVVVTTLVGCGSATFSGPYANGLLALAVAEAEHQADRAAGGTGDVRFSVAALYPTVDPRELEEQTSAFAEPDSGADHG